MYRSRCLLGKQTKGCTTRAILSSRSHSVSARTSTRRLLELSSSIKNKGGNGQLMSTVSKGNYENRLYWGYTVAFGIMFGGSVTLVSKYNDTFRNAVEDAIPPSKSFFSYVIPRTPGGASPDELLTATQTENEVEVQAEQEEQIPLSVEKGGDVVVVNMMDLPSPSQIDFNVGKEHVTVEEEYEIIGSESDLLPETAAEDEIAKGSESALLPATAAEEEKEEEVQVQEAEHETNPLSVEKGDGDVFINIMDAPSPSQIDFEIGKEHVTTVKKGEIVGSENEIVTQTEEAEEISGKLLKSKIQQQSHILTTAYENLKIILDDTITTKTSAAGMLHGYVTQFGQALLVPKEDLAYESIWDAISMLEHSIQESIYLVRAKETEVSSQVKNIKELVYDIRKYEISDIADKSEDLILSSNESLLWVESEIELLTNKVNLLVGFQKQLDGSPEKLQKYLHVFIPDLIKLLNSKQIDIQKLSNEDALLLLSLRRTELIDTELKEKETKQNLWFEATLQKQEENVRKEANEHLINVVEKLEADKKNELNEKVKDLKQLHENHLQEELKIQYEVHQQELHDASANLESELAAHNKIELELMLNDQADKHYHEVMNNLSYLRGIESKIGDVLDIDEKSRINQHLWAAVHALHIALNDTSENGRTKQLISEISNILQCNHNDDIISTIISTVPKHAANLGVIPETALMQRFNDIKRVCKKVAMVKDEGSAFSYVFSYIKSLFVISRFYQRHVSDEVDLETIGPYEILEKADYYIQQGDLEQAAKFMNQLKGVSKKLCTEWLKEVRLLLETKQSANLLMAYAVGSLVAGFE